MPRKLPVSPRNKLLPFQNSDYSYGDFEGFFADFLRLGPSIKISRDNTEFEGKITNAWRYETSGDAQNGIDIRAEVQVRRQDGSTLEETETWAFQCKHRKSWTDKQTRAAIEHANEKFSAAFHFLLVTCDLGTKAVDEGRSHSGWQMWSREDMTSRVRSLKNRDEAARLVNTYFGPHWAEEILGLSGSGPLQGVGAFFTRHMEAGNFHHHRAEIIGRQSEVNSLHAFLSSSNQRLLILPGAGGSGKSRLLRAFAQSLSNVQRRKWSVRFYENIGIPVKEFDLKALEGDPVIVIDDAHRHDIESLISLVLRSKKAKIILSTRPQGVALIRGAVSGAGVDARCVQELPTLKKLTPKETKHIAESLLGNEFLHFAPNVVAKANNCLLIVVVACEMIRQKQLTEIHFASNQDFEQAVFVRLIDERIARLAVIADRHCIDQMLDLVALAGPIPREGPWFDLLCEWIAPASKPHQIRNWLESLTQCGLLTEKDEGYRITPDLLSDYLLFKASFDTNHRDRGFVADVLAKAPYDLKDEALARCLPNLAEAEWRANCETAGKQQSVIEPLLERWITQFQAASFRRRREMLNHWSRFGVYLPTHTLRIARLARELSSTNAPNENGMFGVSQDDYSKILDSTTPMLKEIALYHPEHMHACFDLLWEIGRDQPKRRMHSNQDHPISAIIDVAKLEYRKLITINQNALDWMEKLFRKSDTIRRLDQPVWWFSEMLGPFFKYYVEDEQFDDTVFSIQHVAVDAKRVASLRDRVLELVSKIADGGSEGVVINAIKVIGEGIRMVNIPGLKGDDDLQLGWLPQRRTALSKLEYISKKSSSGFVHWAIWGELWWHICYEPTKLLRKECWDIFNLLKDSFELRIVRAACSSGDSEITSLHKAAVVLSRENGIWEKSRELWGRLCEEVAQEITIQYSDAKSLCDFLADFVLRAAHLGFPPWLGSILFPLAKKAPDLADALTREVLSGTRKEIDHAFANLVDGLSAVTQSVRLDIVEAAAKSDRVRLNEEASSLLIAWRRQGRLPKEGEKLLFQLIRAGCSLVVRSALRDALRLSEKDGDFVSLLLTCVLENPTTDDITEPLLALLDKFEHEKSPLLDSGLVASLLSRLISVPRVGRPMEQYHIASLVKTHPKEVFGFFRQRVEYSAGCEPSDLFDEKSYEAIPREGDYISLSFFSAMPEFDIEFSKIRDELIAEMKRRNSVGDDSRIFEHGGPSWNLRQLARWMLDDSGQKHAGLVSEWVSSIVTWNDFLLFLDVAVGGSGQLVLKHPQILRSVLLHVKDCLPQHFDEACEGLMWSVSRRIGSSRSLKWRKVGDSIPPEVTEPGQIIPQVEQLMKIHAHQSPLKEFYEDLMSKCQHTLKYHQRVDRMDEQMDD